MPGLLWAMEQIRPCVVGRRLLVGVKLEISSKMVQVTAGGADIAG